jgi:hypothetical protein
LSDMTINQAVQSYLAPRRVRAGETVQFGWLIFRIAEPGPPAVLESLDFKQMASFTRDLSAAERVWRAQHNRLREHDATEEPCSLQHSAIVSKSYRPGHSEAFIKRDTALEGHSSGWYVGVLNEQLSMDDEGSFGLKSLYELSIMDDRMLAWWLMPVGTTVVLKGEVVK